MSSNNATKPTSKAARERAENAAKGTAGTTVYGLASVVLGKQVAVKKYGNLNYNKTFIKGSVIRAYDGRKQGAKQAQWKVEARWNIPGYEEGQVYTVRRQDAHLVQPKPNPVTVIANFPDSIDHRDDHPTKGSSTYLATASSDLTAESSVPSVASSAAGVGATADTAGLKRPHELISIGEGGSNDNVGVGGLIGSADGPGVQPPMQQSQQTMAAVGTGGMGRTMTTTTTNEQGECMHIICYIHII